MLVSSWSVEGGSVRPRAPETKRHVVDRPVPDGGRERQKALAAELEREKYHERAEHGLCVKCGREAAKPGCVHGPRCLALHAEKRRKKR